MDGECYDSQLLSDGVPAGFLVGVVVDLEQGIDDGRKGGTGIRVHVAWSGNHVSAKVVWEAEIFTAISDGLFCILKC